MWQKSIFFLGIGGIGMSALARYMRAEGFSVAGYDRIRSLITDALQAEGIDVFFSEDEEYIPQPFRDKNTTLVVYTPAIPKDHPQLLYFENNGFKIVKRAELLGLLTSPDRGKKALCVAGTHGKTTTSTILAHLLYSSQVGCDAFLGGISNNYNSNLLLFKDSKIQRFEIPTFVGMRRNPHAELVSASCSVSDPDLRQGEDGQFTINNSEFAVEIPCQARNEGSARSEACCKNFVVAEADEYDRSFLQLQPYMAVITNCEADHLDIYGTEEAYKEAFAEFAERIVEGGVLLRHTSVKLRPLKNNIRQYTYAVCREGEKTDADFFVDNIRIKDSKIYFDFHLRDSALRQNDGGEPTTSLKDLCLGVPVLVAVEDSVAAVAVSLMCGVERDEIYKALASYSGVYRRFNVLFNNGTVVYIDDYAHHPTEIAATISSVRSLYPKKRIVGIFQPHLYTRTRDFADDFAAVLASLDEVVLMPIYPAREEPIEGIDSNFLKRKIEKLNHKVSVMSKDEICDLAKDFKDGILLTLGAGNIENMRNLISSQLTLMLNSFQHLIPFIDPDLRQGEDLQSTIERE